MIWGIIMRVILDWIVEKNCCPILTSIVSGSPIIKDRKPVGAVTHVLVNDPTRGNGIYIENMLNTAGKMAEVYSPLSFCCHGCYHVFDERKLAFLTEADNDR